MTLPPESSPTGIAPAVSRSDLLPVLGIILLALILYHPLLLGCPVMPDTWERIEPWNSELGYDGPLDSRITNANNDAVLLYIPWNRIAHDQLRSGNIPAWDPYCLSGVPLAANHLVPVFYPLYALIALIFPTLFIMGVSGLIHTILMAIFFYLFLKEWIGNRIAAVLPACFLIVSLLPNPHYQPWPMTLAWFPAIWFFYERWLKHRNPWAGLWMALCWAMPLLAGYPSLFFQMSIFTAVWFLVRPQMMPSDTRPSWGARFGILLWPFAIALGLSAVQNIPTIIASMNSDRAIFKSSQELAREASFTIPANQPWQMHIKRLLQPMIPFRFPGNDFFNRGYIGVIPVMFALLSLAWISRRKYPLIVLWLALIVLPFALIPSANFAVYSLTRGILIDPNPPLEVFGFLIFMLMGWGIYFWNGSIDSGPEYQSETTVGLTLAFIVFIGVWASRLWISPGSLVPGYIPSLAAVLGLLAIGMPFILRNVANKLTISILPLAVALLIAAVMLPMNYLASRQGDGSLLNRPMAETDTIRQLRELTDPDLGGEWGRMIRYSTSPVNVMSLSGQPYTFYPNLGTYFGIPDAFGYFNLAPASRLDYLRNIQPDAVVERRGIVAFTQPVDPFDERLAEIGVRFILANGPLENHEPVFAANNIWIYENPDAEAINIERQDYNMPGLMAGLWITIIAAIVWLLTALLVSLNSIRRQLPSD